MPIDCPELVLIWHRRLDFFPHRTHFARQVFLVRANLVFAGVIYKQLRHMTTEAIPFYNPVPVLADLGWRWG